MESNKFINVFNDACVKGMHFNKFKAENDLETLSSRLNWKGFEALAEDIFSSFNMVTKRNYRLKRPKAEIDLIAFKDEFVFCVDCKHWKRTVGQGTMTKIAEAQISRSRRLLEELNNANAAIPIILTRYDEYIYALPNRVPVIPIFKLSTFLTEWQGYIDRIMIIKRKG